MHILYLAALVDGEGSIGVHKQLHRGAKNDSYKVRVRVCNTCKKLIDAVQEVYGSSVYLQNRKKVSEGWRPVYEWCLSGRQALVLIRRLLPHLLVKQRQAEAVLRFEPLIRPRYAKHPVTPQEALSRRTLYEQVKAMNQASRGKVNGDLAANHAVSVSLGT